MPTAAGSRMPGLFFFLATYTFRVFAVSFSINLWSLAWPYGAYLAGRIAVLLAVPPPGNVFAPVLGCGLCSKSVCGIVGTAPYRLAAPCSEPNFDTPVGQNVSLQNIPPPFLESLGAVVTIRLAGRALQAVSRPVAKPGCGPNDSKSPANRQFENRIDGRIFADKR